MDEVVLISLFDGIGGALRALDMAGVGVRTVATSETDVDAARVTKYAWPHVIEWGDIIKISAEEILRLKQLAPNARHVLITAGSPCQDLSGLNAKRKGLHGARSGLFFEILRVKELVEKHWPGVKITLMVENVASMSSEARVEMSAALGAEPVFVDARDVSHCHRPRLYWFISPLTWEWQCSTSVHGQSVTRLHLPGGCGPVSRWIKK
eukprot:1791629-Karenia_brevis.AAC.1